MRCVRWVSLLCLSTLLSVSPAHAHEGHVHADAEDGASAPAAAVAVTRAASSSRHELVMRAPALRPGEEVRLDLYVSDWSTNAPVTGANVAVDLRGRDGAAGPSRVQATPVAEGQYAATLRLPETGDYNVLVTVGSSLGTDEFALRAVRVEPAAAASSRSQSPILWLALGALGLIALIVTGAFVSGRRRANPAAPILLLAATLLAPGARAHEGHAHADETAASAPVPGEVERVNMPKPSQFLLGVRTQVVRLESVPRQVALLGRVAPRGGSETDIVAPQAGRIDLAGRRAPVLGQRVARGQLIGHLVVVDSLAIRAPIGGVVTASAVVHGQRVEAGQKLVSLLDPSVVWVHADVYERDLAAVERSTRAVITSDAWPGRRFAGRRLALGASVSKLPGTIEGWFEVPNPGGHLRVGLPVSVSVELGGAEPLAVLPRAAVLEDGGRASVWVHESPEGFASRPVEVRVRLGERFAVRGLHDGDRVVVAGAPAVAALPRVSEAP